MTLARYLDRHGLTAADCARGTGRTRAIVSAWLLGIRFPTFRSMELVAAWSKGRVAATAKDWPRRKVAA